MSVSADVLRACIPLIFEKAVAEPTFCVLYADLCAVLTRELDASPRFGNDETGKAVTFKRELLNTCAQTHLARCCDLGCERHQWRLRRAAVCQEPST